MGLGPAVGSILAGWIVVSLGWEWAFILFGIAGLLVLPIWLWAVRDAPAKDRRVSAEERAWIGNRAIGHEGADWPGIHRVFFSRTGFGMLPLYLTFGYILFTFLNWVPSYMFYTFHMGILKSSAWSSLGALLGFIGFIISGPFNDSLVRRYDRLTARRIGTAAPMAGAALCVVLSLFSADAGAGPLTAVLIGLVQLLMNMTVRAWAVNIIDISPNQASTGFVYGIFNGVLNDGGAQLADPDLARDGLRLPIAFGSALFFTAIFLVSILFVVDTPSYSRLVGHAQETQLSPAQ